PLVINREQIEASVKIIHQVLNGFQA
ncbi:MAG: hypothetical protein RLZZ45_1181, partial [Bacteroidota bacterium]